jgi:hypothetical protein
VLIPCSRSAHDQNVLARRPRGINTGAILKERCEQAWKDHVIGLFSFDAWSPSSFSHFMAQRLCPMR